MLGTAHDDDELFPEDPDDEEVNYTGNEGNIINLFFCMHNLQFYHCRIILSTLFLIIRYIYCLNF